MVHNCPVSPYELRVRQVFIDRRLLAEDDGGVPDRSTLQWYPVAKSRQVGEHPEQSRRALREAVWLLENQYPAPNNQQSNYLTGTTFRYELTALLYMTGPIWSPQRQVGVNDTYPH